MNKLHLGLNKLQRKPNTDSCGNKLVAIFAHHLEYSFIGYTQRLNELTKQSNFLIVLIQKECSLCVLVFFQSIFNYKTQTLSSINYLNSFIDYFN